MLAYDGAQVVGWAAVHPRSDTSFATSRTIPHVDERDVWSVWCIRVRPGHRGQGISHGLLAGRSTSLDSPVHRRPKDAPWTTTGRRSDLTMAYVGTRNLFETAGFSKAADTTSVLNGFRRVLMRLNLE